MDVLGYIYKKPSKKTPCNLLLIRHCQGLLLELQPYEFPFRGRG